MFSNLHEQEEAEFGRGPLLWDADPEVCCAAFQLGACCHTEGFGEDEGGWDGDLGQPWGLEASDVVEIAGGHVDLGEEEPF